MAERGRPRRFAPAGTAVGGPRAPRRRRAELLDDAIVAALLPERPARGHKGTFGKLLVIAGSLDYAGAALLVCRAAGRAGAGLVTLAVPESLQPLFAAKVVEATTMALPEDDVEEVEPEPPLARIIDHEHDALVVGPGLRPGLATAELVAALLAVEDDGGPRRGRRRRGTPLAGVRDGWWDGIRRPCVLTPHAGEFARLRAASGVPPDADGDLSDDDAAPGGGRPDRGRPGARSSCSRVPGPSSPPRTAGRPAPRGRTRRSRRVAPATSWPARSARSSRRASTRTTRRGSGVYLHGAAGDVVRDRLGDAGLQAGDLPIEITFARKRLAATAHRRTRPARLGFGVRRPRRHAVDRLVTARRSIEERLADAGLTPLPRTAWLELDLDRLLGNLGALRAALPPGVRLEPVLKADAYGHGAVPIGRALEAAGADGFSVATFDEAVELRQGGLRAPILCLYAVPASVVREAMRLDVAVTASSEELLERMVAAAHAAWRGEGGPDPGARCASTSTSRPGSGGPGSTRSGSAPRSVGSGTVRASGWPASGRTSSRRTTASGPIARRCASRPRSAASPRPGPRASAAPGEQRRAARARRPGVRRVRIGLAIYGIVPDDVPAAVADDRTPPRASGRSCRSMPGRSASPTCRPGRGSATARRSARAVRAGSRPSRWAMATACRARSRIGPRPSSAGSVSRSSATWRWTR